ncbi:MAG: hypothetical protein AAFZ18_36665 [Myxococcota bacterium]
MVLVSTRTIERDTRIRELLDQLADRMIQDILAALPDVREGHVMTIGPPAYRRLDCDGRALAYVRSRPRRLGVRIEISGLWSVPSRSELQVASAAGVALLCRSYGDIDEAIRCLREVVEATREAEIEKFAEDGESEPAALEEPADWLVPRQVG